MKRPMLLILAAMVGLWLWLFAGVLFGQRNFAYRDAAHFYYPLYELIQNEWGAGRIPLWNPYDNGGQPLLANPTAGVLYPLKLIFALPIAYRTSYAIFILWHLLQAMLAATWVTRSWGASRLASLMAGISFAFCGNVLFQYCNVIFLIGAAWLPLAWWFGERMLRQSQWTAAIGLGACLAMMVLGGDPQMAYVAGLSVAAYAVRIWYQRQFELAQPNKNAKNLRHQRSTAKKTTRASSSHDANGLIAAESLSARLLTFLTRHPLGLLTLAAVSSGLFCAVQVLPTEEFSRQSTRAIVPVPRSISELIAYAFKSPETPPGVPASAQMNPAWYVGLLGKAPQTDQHHLTIYHFSVSPWRMVEYLFPNVSGRTFPTNGRWLERFQTESAPWVPSLYMGIIPCVLALLALRFRRFHPEVDSTLKEQPVATISSEDASRSVRVLQNPAVIGWLSWLVLIFLIMSWGGYGPGWIARCLTTGQLSPPGRHHAAQIADQGLPVGDEFGGLYWFFTILLPGFVQFRFPGKMLLPAALGLSWLAAIEFDRVLTRPAARSRFQAWMKRLFFVSASGIVAVVLMSFIWKDWTQSVTPNEYFGKFDVWSGYTDLLGAFIQTGLLTGICGWILKPLPQVEQQQTTDNRPDITTQSFWPATALVLLTIIDLGWANGWMISTAPAEIWNENPQCAELLQAADQHWKAQQTSGADNLTDQSKSEGPYRVFRISSWYPPEWRSECSAQHLIDAMKWDHDTIFSKFNSSLRLDMFNGSSTLDLSETSQFLNPAFLPMDDKSVQYVQPRRGLDLWNVKYFILPARNNASSQHESTLGLTNAWNEPRWSPAQPQGQPAGPPLENAVPSPDEYLKSSPDLRVLYNPFYMPRAWIVHDIVGIPPLNSFSGPLAMGTMQAILFPVNTWLDPRQTVVIENSAIAGNRLAPQGAVNSNFNEESVRVTKYEPLAVTLEGELKSPGAVVLADAYYPGWEVSVVKEGTTTATENVFRANLGMRGVLLPAGRFQLVFQYRPFWFYVGAIISGVAWLTLSGALILLWCRRRRNPPDRSSAGIATTENIPPVSP